ncbi:unnamed protein product [Brachionus calyciflorus]|uniref:Uncharacterized protein n=1 Tax=Brachionus calyciflorus TaxID=104777 RepID=A0A813QW31_9BILA|nr:unnamed protein product [Brachionus calyciflorus]
MVRIFILTVLVGFLGQISLLPIEDQLEQEAIKAYLNGITENMNSKVEPISPRDEFKLLMDSFKTDLVNRLYQKIRDENLSHQSNEMNGDLMKRSSYKNSAKLAFSGLIGKLHSSG